MTASATLFVVSAYALSTRALTRIEHAAGASAHGDTRLIRLEETGPSLIDALNSLRADGYRDILVQPLGLPFSEGILAWLPGVLAHWRQRGDNADTVVSLGPDPATDTDALARFISAARNHPDPVHNVEHVRPSLGKPRWNTPPDFTFHLLICTGPRCAVHGAQPLAQMLKEELKTAGVFDQCLTTRTGCIYPCNRGPVLALYPHGQWFCLPDRHAIRRFVIDVLVNGGRADDLCFHTTQAAPAKHLQKMDMTS